MAIKNRPEFNKFIRRVEKSSDEFRASSTEKRHSKQYRTARENLAHLVDQDSFLEFGQFAVAAQRSRRDKCTIVKESQLGPIVGQRKVMPS